MTPTLIILSITLILITKGMRRETRKLEQERYKKLLLAKIEHNKHKIEMFGSFLDDCIDNHDLDRGDVWADRIIQLCDDNDGYLQEIERI